MREKERQGAWQQKERKLLVKDRENDEVRKSNRMEERVMRRVTKMVERRQEELQRTNITWKEIIAARQTNLKHKWEGKVKMT